MEKSSESKLRLQDFETESPEVLEIKEKWIKEQLEFKKNLITTDDITWKLDSTDPNIQLKFIGGVDISFVKDNNVDACASLIVLSYPDFKVVYSKFEMVQLTLPYIPSFLAFREVPFLVKLIEDLRQSQPELFPQLIMVDGNGILHPRGFGLASHLGVLTGVPTIGIGKTHFVVDNISVQKVKDLQKTLTKGGDVAHLVGDSGTVWGALLRATDDSSKAIYVSQGHKVSLETTLEVTKKCCLYRVPEPVRQADLMSRDFIRKNVK